MAEVERVTFEELARRYCERQEQTPAGLLAALRAQVQMLGATGWFLAECQDMSSAGYRGYVVLCYGPACTFQEVPTCVFLPRGLASDMSVAVAYLLAEDLPAEQAAES